MNIQTLKDLVKHKVLIEGPRDVDGLSSSGNSVFTYKHGVNTYDFIFKPSSEKRLFVLFSGANRRASHLPLPIFQRWKWLDRFPGYVLNVADPSLRFSDDLTLAWYISTGIDDPMHPISHTITALAERFSIKPSNVILWGSSGGGFAALRCSALLPDSLAVAVNPQVVITDYFESHVIKMLKSNFNGISIRRFKKKYPLINSAIAWSKQWSHSQRVLYAQNSQDSFHLRGHARPYCQAFNIPFEGGWNRTYTKQLVMFDSDNGHGPEPEEFFPELLERALTFQETAQEKQNAFQTVSTPTLQKAEKIARAPLSSFLIASNQAHIRQEGESLHSQALRFCKSRNFRPRRDIDAVKLSKPVVWTSDPFKDTNWRMQLHALRCLAPLCVAHNAKPNAQFIQAGLDIIKEWADDNLVNSKSDFAWYDMSTGIRALYIAYFTQEMLAYEDEDFVCDLDYLRDIIIAHMQVLADEDKFSLNNHGFFQAHGLMALLKALTMMGYNAPDYQRLPSEYFERLIEQQFGQEGMHMEHSPDYHFFAEKLFRQFVETGWYDDNDRLQGKLSKISAAGHWLRAPSGCVYPIGDSSQGTARADCSANDLGGDILKTRAGSYHAKIFTEAGYAFARSAPELEKEKQGYLTFFAGHHDYAHKHADDLAVTWNDRDQDILIDSGKYGYFKDKWRTYVVSTRAHNTIEIDNKSGPRAKKFAYGNGIKALELGEDNIALTAEVLRPEFKVIHNRTVHWQPGQKLSIIDKVKATNRNKHSYISWLHFAPLLTLRMQDDHVLISDAEGNPFAKLTYSDNMSVYRLERGNEEDVLGWYSPAYSKIAECFSLGLAVENANKKLEVTITLI